MENEAQMILDDTISFCERDGVDTDHKHRRNHAQNIHINLSRRLYRWESSCVISSHVTPLSAISTIM